MKRNPLGPDTYCVTPMINKTPKLSKAERAAYALVGRVGGKATAKKLGKKGMSTLGTKGAKVRWANHKASKKLLVK